MTLGPHAGFILTAYGAGMVIIVGLVLWVVLDRLRLGRVLDELQAQGLTRRSEQRSGNERR